MKHKRFPEPKIVTFGPHYAHTGLYALKACFPVWTRCCGWKWRTRVMTTYTVYTMPGVKTLDDYCAAHGYLLWYGIKNGRKLTESEVTTCDRYGLLDRNN